VAVSLQQTQPTYDYALEVDVQLRFEDGSLSDVVTVSVPLGKKAVDMQMDVRDRGPVAEVILDPNVRLLANFNVTQGN
jgi:hypothetical protein